ncbi:MAG TPA: hypothetical protein VHB50_12375, partial [Bryobacteraceae bacterium]|nr:hypothetical protein [Bryobacteraceae bacterium]
MTYSILLSSKSLQNFMELLALAAIALAFVAPRLASRPFHALERTLSAFSRKRWHAALAVALFPMVVRVLLLPVFPFPLPRVHDEFSYLLLGDTLAHGRVANPTPPYFKHFETEYELVKPAYASQYEPGQGLFLAAGEVAAGHPWWGVWLSMGILCGVLCWALGFVLPPRWAFFGAMLAALQFGIYGYWMNSYFGGAAAAIGGALVFGGLTRKPRSPVVCALGLLVLFATRPAEAFLWSAAVIWLGWKNVSRRTLVPFLTTFALGATVLAAYNYRITGSPAQPPYSLYREAYGTPQSYWWQPPVVVTKFDHPELARNY